MSKADKTEPTCGDKHLRVILAILALVALLCLSTIAYCNTGAEKIEARVRTVEQAEAANAARFDAIQDSLRRLEKAVQP